MRIYIENYNYHGIDLHCLEHLVKSEKVIKEIYTCDGNYVIDKRLYKLNLIENGIEKQENYLPDINILLDKTVIKKQQQIVSHLPIDKLERDLKLLMFNLREKSPLTMVCTYENDIIVDFYFMLFKTYAAYSMADLNNFSIKEDIQEFLKLIGNKK
tara:strand:- start:5213 stop:5680 length:468 start_codon:yes stop_codon:yes gene_type:complete